MSAAKSNQKTIVPIFNRKKPRQALYAYPMSQTNNPASLTNAPTPASLAKPKRPPSTSATLSSIYQQNTLDEFDSSTYNSTQWKNHAIYQSALPRKPTNTSNIQHPSSNAVAKFVPKPPQQLIKQIPNETTLPPRYTAGQQQNLPEPQNNGWNKRNKGFEPLNHTMESCSMSSKPNYSHNKVPRLLPTPTQIAKTSANNTAKNRKQLGNYRQTSSWQQVESTQHYNASVTSAINYQSKQNQSSHCINQTMSILTKPTDNYQTNSRPGPAGDAWPQPKPIKKPKNDSIGLRVVPASITKMKIWSQLNSQMNMIFEIFGELRSVGIDHSYRSFRLSDREDTVQCIFYEIDRGISQMEAGKIHKCIGNYDQNTDVFRCFSVRQLTDAEFYAYESYIDSAEVMMNTILATINEI
ncbi:uncharacterized protein LOC141899749 [Tubulanus polymorphus]|uniref:uncharacterized protein LOC141899749 n=1 Tax=Tubulanus polymorphus TaxID=672921 RepID=UPI003DA383F0